MKEKEIEIRKGMIVQLSRECINPMFAYCLLVVTEPTNYGCVGYVQALGKDWNTGGQAYYRAIWSEIEYCGDVIWFEE